MSQNEKRIPGYEGHAVHGTAIKMSGAIPMDDLEGAVIGIDDIVQMICQFRCVAVNHIADKNGDLIRVHVLRPFMMVPHAIEGELEGPDDYIMRALPRPIQGQLVSIEGGE